ncbi:sensor histidine kinase [Aggregatimonas sangjinii]|uniref:Sensor histidine kinase n=1 Tax=Aggregatimonas sangjinii TaxID=2583587 RepID=A0A5B7SX48_9FLAO|nr:histidine kinase [Aggregatimonas sangjinii]QCX01773.1 sensor histidine kinase [Aggregatimonas sangjinii]
MDFQFWKSNKRLKKWVLRVFLVGTALLIVIFNDAFGDNEPFQIFAVFYFLLLIFLFIRWTFKQLKTIIKLKNEKAKTELQHLKSQVNPHFFFNTLNNLYGLVGKDPDKAQNLILKLSDMMRYSIYEGEREFVTIEEEVAYLKNYIELHRMRYHKTIDIRLEEDIKKQGFLIMPLLFILLLENAFKHGVENLRENAFVHIGLVVNEKEVQFTVRNNFDASEVSVASGIGLKNLKRRLELAYPDNHSLAIKSKEGVYTAQLSLKRQ